jgi:hypothetical protein
VGFRGNGRSTVQDQEGGEELERYRRKGAGRTARHLIEGLSEAVLIEGTLSTLPLGLRVPRATFTEGAMLWPTSAAFAHARLGQGLP